MGNFKQDEFIDSTAEKHQHYWKFARWAEEQFGEDWRGKLSGYEVMEKIEKYADENPAIKIAYCDDEMFASSFIVLIPHPKMGISMLIVPQLTTVTSNIFLYPGHYNSLIEAINELKSITDH